MLCAKDGEAVVSFPARNGEIASRQGVAEGAVRNEVHDLGK